MAMKNWKHSTQFLSHLWDLGRSMIILVQLRRKLAYWRTPFSTYREQPAYFSSCYFSVFCSKIFHCKCFGAVRWSEQIQTDQKVCNSNLLLTTTAWGLHFYYSNYTFAISRKNATWLVSYITGFLICGQSASSVSHLISWKSHKRKQLIGTIEVSETLADGGRINLEKRLLLHFIQLLTSVLVSVCFRLKSFVLDCGYTAKMYLQVDLRLHNCITYELGTKTFLKMIWILAILNIADAVT